MAADGSDTDTGLLLSKVETDANFVALNIEETMAVLTRCSFDESHRQPIFLLGGVPAIAELIKVIISPDIKILLTQRGFLAFS